MLRKLIKKILKTMASYCIWYKWRIWLLRRCGFEIGRDVYIGDGLIIVEELLDRGHVKIGDRASLAPRVTLVTSSHPNNSKIRPFVPTPRGKIIIEPDAWIGAGAILFPDVTVGQGAVVGAGSVVTKSVESYTIVAGIPAKRIAEVSIPDNER
jgi:acetyltransferase-like isoleucine patch superfamily enzyme